MELETSSDSLTEEANLALKCELERRGISTHASRTSSTERETSPIVRRRPLPASLVGVRAFTEQVLDLYHQQFWLFLKLNFPAMVTGYIAIMFARSEAQEAARHILRGSPTMGYQLELVGIGALKLTGYFVSWGCSCLSFAATCAAIRQIAVGNLPSLSNSFVALRGRTGSLLRLSLLLFVLLLVGIGIALFASVTVLWALARYHVGLSPLIIQSVTMVFLSAPLLALTRFGLAVPAVVFENCRVSQAMFRSDELTEGKWLVLAALLGKSLVGGYVAALCPFWLASLTARAIDLPSWIPKVLPLASYIGATLVEPILFIGFALLYLEMCSTGVEMKESHRSHLLTVSGELWQ